MARSRGCLVISVILSVCPAWAQDFLPGPTLGGAPTGERLTGDLPEGISLQPHGGQSSLPGDSLGVPTSEPLPTLPGPTPRPAVGSTATAPALAERLTESTWYTRIDYFHWNERLDGADFVNEDGPLVTLGYTRRVGPERFRIELFGGDVNYDGAAQFDDGTLDPLSSKTGYLGTRAEYDLLLEPDWPSRLSFLVGVGTRFWFRDLRDGVSQAGYAVSGYQETWWTIYPYLGLETRRDPQGGPEFFYSGRIGATAVTYEHATYGDAVLRPKPDLTGQLEGGLRSRHLHLSAFFEGMAWRQSSMARGALQPRSQMYTIGLKTGFTF